MQFAGLQKLTLLDYPGKCACTVFTDGCNFRCPFCHNADLVLPGAVQPAYSEEDILAFLKKRRGVLDGVAVTGGEPLIHKDIKGFLYKVKELGYPVKLDTNGSFPGLLKELAAEGLIDRVAMDVKNSPELYARTAGVEGLDLSAIEESRDFLLGGSLDYEFRTTVVKGLHTEESIRGAARWIAGAKEYYLQQFKDSGNILEGTGLSGYGRAEMEELARAAAEYVPSVKTRGV